MIFADIAIPSISKHEAYVDYLNKLCDCYEARSDATLKRLQELGEVFYDDNEWFWTATGEVVGGDY